MTLFERIDSDLKKALKESDKFRLSVLRMLKSELMVESRKGSLHDLTEDEVITVIKRQVKTRKDSAKEYESYNRLDIASELLKEVEILKEYLPEELSDKELNKILDQVFEKVNPSSIKDMGSIMRELKPLVGNKADMGLVNSLIKERLN